MILESVGKNWRRSLKLVSAFVGQACEGDAFVSSGFLALDVAFFDHVVHQPCNPTLANECAGGEVNLPKPISRGSV